MSIVKTTTVQYPKKKHVKQWFDSSPPRGSFT
ncbi:hypothetical protein L915_02857, partial [Phytophthora nicotianae]